MRPLESPYSRAPIESAWSRRWWRPLWEGLAVAVGLVYWGVFGLAFTLVSLPLLWLAPREWSKRTGRKALHWAFRGFVRYLRATDLVHADLDSLGCLKRHEGAAIIAPNHGSLWDAVFVISCLPEPICIMKAGILRNPFLGGGARLAGYIPNDSPTRVVKAAAAALEGGGQLLLFPEGTRTRREARWINPLNGGCALIARRAGVPVIPVYIRSNSRFLEKGWPWWKKPDFPIRLSFELGQALRVNEGEGAQEFTARLEAVFEKNLARAHKLRRQVARGE